jgi:ATP-dependent Lhr-like helicase
VRQALDELVRRGSITNDRLDPLRPSARAVAAALTEASTVPRNGRGGVARLRPSPRRQLSASPEGRWSLLECSPAGGWSEDACLAWASILLARYGVVTREMAGLDPWAPPWKDLAGCLARAEMRGEVRRGYFVEGLSGVQYASSDAAEELSRLAAGGPAGTELLLLSTLDPANLYGSGAPFDVGLLEGGTARLVRMRANSLVLCGGRPVLIIEGHGKRLTGLASASENELAASLKLLPRLARPPRRVLKVQTYNGVSASKSAAETWLAEAGFVRDHPGMVYYASC